MGRTDAAASLSFASTFDSGGLCLTGVGSAGGGDIGGSIGILCKYP